MLKKHPYLSGSLILFVLLMIFVILLNSTQSENFSLSQEGSIGVISVDGVIAQSDHIVRQIEQMEKVDSIRGVIVRLNSPGGGVAASQEIFDAVVKLKKKKPVYAAMGSVAASGAYYIACGASKIFANPGTITGSIGVILQWYNFQELSEKIGAKTLTIKSVPNKDLMSMFREPLDPEKQILQQLVDDTHEQFVQAIIQGRPEMDEENIRQLADGRVVAGNRAQTLGLVDELASFSQVVATFADDLGLEGKVRTVQFDKEGFSWISLLGLAPLKQFLDQPTGLRLSYLLQ